MIIIQVYMYNIMLKKKKKKDNNIRIVLLTP